MWAFFFPSLIVGYPQSAPQISLNFKRVFKIIFEQREMKKIFKK